MSDIRIGTSGWSYPGGRGTWDGLFYPARGARPRGFDELAHYASFFDTVEINSSFYRPPAPATVQRWVQRTPPGFEFSFKLYQKFTHPEMFRAAARLAEGERIRVDQPDVDRFRAALEPAAGAGKLGALLAQFPSSFKSGPHTRDYLDWLLGAFRGYPVAVELRDRSWSDDVTNTLALLNEHSAAWVQIDEPKFRFSIRQNFLPNVQGFYYMRLHGRNAANWWRHEQPEDRYDYLYSEDELKPFAETAQTVRQLVKKLYLYMNNHFAAKAPANALVLKHQLGETIAATLPAALVERYHGLKGIGATSPAPLSQTLF